MQATQNIRLHPLLTAAAISVTVFSAVGVASLTGLVPQSIGSAPEIPAPVVEAPKEVLKPIEPAIAHPVPAPAPKPVKKAAVRKPAEPVVYRDFPETYPVAQAPVAAPVAKPVVQPGHVGTVQGVRDVTQKGEHTLMGPAAGGVAGAVLGNQFGHGNGKKIMTVLGAAGGALAGREVEKQARGKKQWEIDVRLDSGAQQAVLSDVEPNFRPGDRVRVVDGRLQPA
jgi:outer membrane lipoprotein SlyB